MSFVTRQAAHCDVCGHEWLVVAEQTPTHCAKCKSRRWNSAPVQQQQVSGHVKAKRLSGEHDTKACRIYKCGMCAAAKS